MSHSKGLNNISQELKRERDAEELVNFLTNHLLNELKGDLFPLRDQPGMTTG